MGKTRMEEKMTIPVYIILGVLLIAAIYLITTYNSFVKMKNMIGEAFSTMDVYLKKRWDLLPNLVETVKGYAKHESSVLENIVSLRSSSYDNMSAEDKIDTNEKLSAGISRLIAVAENYPDLKASKNFSDLSAQLSAIEGEIAQSRKYYNAVVRNMNTKIEMFPSNIIAGLFGFKQSKMFEAKDEERASVKVEL